MSVDDGILYVPMEQTKICTQNLDMKYLHKCVIDGEHFCLLLDREEYA